MKKKSAIAYRDFVIEAEKAFNRIYLQEEELTSSEIKKIKERFSKKQFDKFNSDFENELINNMLKYEGKTFIYAYLKSVFTEACRHVDDNSPMPEIIIKRDFETEFLLNLFETINNAYVFFSYYCQEMIAGSYKPLYKYLDELKAEKTDKKNDETEPEKAEFNPRFDFNNLKSELENVELIPEDKYKLVNDRLYDFMQWQKQYDVYENFHVSWDSPDESKYKYTREYYPNFEKLCKLEIERWQNIAFRSSAEIKKAVSGAGKNTTFKIASKHKTDVVKIFSAMYDCKMFTNTDGQPATNKQELMEALGVFLGEDLKTYSTLLTQAKNKEENTFFSPFKRIMEASKRYYESE